MIKAKNTHTHTHTKYLQLKSTSQDTDMLKKVLLKDLFGGKLIIGGEEKNMQPYIKEKGHLLGKTYKSQAGS